MRNFGGKILCLKRRAVFLCPCFKTQVKEFARKKPSVMVNLADFQMRLYGVWEVGADYKE